MFIGYLVAAVLLALVLVVSGRGKLVRQEQVVTSLTRAGVPANWYPWLAAAEFAGAFGLLVGILFAPLGIAAAIGVTGYFLGAVLAHLRAGDFKGLTAPAPLLVLAVIALLLRIASA